MGAIARLHPTVSHIQSHWHHKYDDTITVIRHHLQAKARGNRLREAMKKPEMIVSLCNMRWEHKVAFTMLRGKSIAEIYRLQRTHITKPLHA